MKICKNKCLTFFTSKTQLYHIQYSFKTIVSKDTYLVGGDNDMKVDEEQIYYYRVQAEHLMKANLRTLQTDMRHLFEWDKTYELRKVIMSEFYRFNPFLEKAVKELMEKVNNDWAKDKQFSIAMNNVPYIKK